MAKIELAIRGQMGQPAACMIKNKSTLHGVNAMQLWPSLLAIQLPTEIVDNFVKKSPDIYAKPAFMRACDR
jgi:hypothetical protein